MTDVRYLNDSTEFSLAVQLLSDRVGELLADPKAIGDDERVFLQHVVSGVRYSVDAETLVGVAGVFALSEHADQLSQWRGYCPQMGGYAIGFDSEQLNSLGGDHISLQKCRYGAGEATEELERFVNRCREVGRTVSNEEDRRGFLERVADFAYAFTDFAGWVKHEKFAEEAEWRLVSRLRDAPPSFRSGTSMIIPYLVLKASDDEQLPIQKIVVGPNPHQNLALASVNSLLKAEGFGEVEVTPSAIPYRML